MARKPKKAVAATPNEEYQSVSSRIRKIKNGWVHSRSTYNDNGASKEVETFHRKRPSAHDRIKRMMGTMKPC